MLCLRESEELYSDLWSDEFWSAEGCHSCENRHEPLRARVDEGAGRGARGRGAGGGAGAAWRGGAGLAAACFGAAGLAGAGRFA